MPKSEIFRIRCAKRGAVKEFVVTHLGAGLLDKAHAPLSRPFDVLELNRLNYNRKTTPDRFYRTWVVSMALIVQWKILSVSAIAQ
jgi:hypothetical protein